MKPTEKDLERARESHCRFCAMMTSGWPSGSPTYAKCRDDVEDAAETFAEARAGGAREERAAILAEVAESIGRNSELRYPNSTAGLAAVNALDSIRLWIEAREKEAP